MIPWIPPSLAATSHSLGGGSSKPQLSSFPVGRTAEKLTPRKTSPELTASTGGSSGWQIREHRATETQPGAEGSPRAPRTHRKHKTERGQGQLQSPGMAPEARERQLAGLQVLGFPVSSLPPLTLQDGDTAQLSHCWSQGKPRKAAPALEKGWEKGESAATLQALREGHRDRHQQTVCRSQCQMFGAEHPSPRPRRHKSCGREEVGTGRVPQTLFAAQAPLRAPDRAADIPSPAGAIQDPGELGRQGRGEAARHKTRESTEGPSLALSKALSQLRQKNEGGEKKQPSNN